MNGEADTPWPDWLNDLVETAAEAIQFKGFGEVECRYRAPDDNTWGTHLLMFAPGLQELAESGPHDGERVWSPVHVVELLPIQQEFDEVTDASYMAANDEDEGDELTVTGTLAGEELTLQVFTVPFPDAEPHLRVRAEQGRIAFEPMEPPDDVA